MAPHSDVPRPRRPQGSPTWTAAHPTLVRYEMRLSHVWDSQNFYTLPTYLGPGPVPDGRCQLMMRRSFFILPSDESGADASNHTKFDFILVKNDGSSETTFSTLTTEGNPPAGKVVWEVTRGLFFPVDYVLKVVATKVGVGSSNLQNEPVTVGVDLMAVKVA